MDQNSVILCSCESDCVYAGTLNEPCWGRVRVVDTLPIDNESVLLLHACEGHATVINYGQYDGHYLNNWNMKHLS